MNKEKETNARVHGLLPQKLAEMARLLQKLGNPHEHGRYIHIAGTNGKGSTAAFLARILQEAGYRTGLFTSPHMQCYNDRFRINGIMIADEALSYHRARVEAAEREAGLTPNYFRTAAALAFAYFEVEGCDFVILETGLGGRLDPTNIVPAPILTLITRIGLDHEAVLGDSLPAIAAEKAGILKPGAPLFFTAQEKVAEQVLLDAAQTRRVDAQRVLPLEAQQEGGTLLLLSPLGRLRPGIGGAYQAENAALALAAAQCLASFGFGITDAHRRAGIEHARWPGRCELLHPSPPVLFDGAHNPQGARALVSSLRMLHPSRRVVFIIGVMREKRYAALIAALAPAATAMIAIAPEEDRALPSKELAREMRLHLDAVYDGETMEKGLRIAKALLKDDCMVCICGSLYLSAPAHAAVATVFTEHV